MRSNDEQAEAALPEAEPAEPGSPESEPSDADPGASTEAAAASEVPAGGTAGSTAGDPSDGTSGTAGDTAPKERKRFSLPAPVAAGLGVLLVVAVGAAVTFGLLYKNQADVQTARNEALATARAYASTVTGYDYKNLDKNFSDVLDGATGKFKDQYAGASKTLRQMIRQAKATAKGEVLDAAVKSATEDRVDVAVFVDQSVTNAATKKPRIDRSRVLMTLEKHDDRWLVSKLEMV